MTSAAVLAVGAISPLGVGEQAFGGLAFPHPVSTLRRDEILLSAGLTRPCAARIPDAWLNHARGTTGAKAGRAEVLLTEALLQVTRSLDDRYPHWKSKRLGIAMGTSSGGMETFEQWVRCTISQDGEAAALAAHGTYTAPLHQALGHVGLGQRHPSVHRWVPVLAACAASTMAIGLGLRWLETDTCDVVLVGGYDALSLFVAAGFEAMRATSPTFPAPFAAHRDGMALGEGAAVLALVPSDHTSARQAAYEIRGFGASTDAFHITAPDPEGRGLTRACLAALADAAISPRDVGLVSAHATATPFNDAMESKALRNVFAADAVPPVHAFKAHIGHTLGAAGALETLAAAHGLTSGFIPPTVGLGETDPEAAVTLVREPAPLSKAAALKVSAAFGGANAAIVLQTRRRSIDGTCFEEHPLKPHRQSRQRYGVRLAAVASAPSPDLSWLSERTGRPLEKLSRLDALCRWGLAAVAALHEKVNVHHAGLVCGHTFATASTNHAFYERLLRRGAAQGDPRAFPYTSPNALVGECAIAFQLTGPSLAVGGDLQGPLTALQVGVDFVSWGETPRMVVVAADDGGPCADALTHAMGFASMPPGAVALLLERDSAQETMPQSPFAKGSLKWPPLCTPELWGHRALEAWLSPFNGTETVAVG